MSPSLNTRHVALGGLFALAIGIVTLAPVFYVLVTSFDIAPEGAPYQFGLEAWREIFTNAKTWQSILYSFILAIRVPVAVCVGFCIAWLLVRAQIPGHRGIELAFWFAFLLPGFPMMMGWILLLDANFGLVNLALVKLPFISGPVFSIYSAPGIMWVHLALTTLPIMVILLTPMLRQLDASLEEAADMAGAPLSMTLRKITIPLLLPAIATAFLLSLIRSLEAFEVERILGTPVNINVYSTRIFDYVSLEPPLFPQAMALSALFLVILLSLAIVYQVYLERTGSRPTLSGKGVRLQPRHRSWWTYAASAALILYLLFTLLLPLVVLILGSFNKLFGFFFLEDAWTTAHWAAVFGDTRFLRAGIASGILGLVVGFLGILIFSAIAWVLVRAKPWGSRVATVLIWLPWAIPGLVLGVTLLSLMLETPGLKMLYGTMAPLLIALLIKELPIGVQMLRTSIAQVSGELEEAAVMSGARFSMIFRRITLPLIAPMLASVFLLIFASAMRDVSTVVLIAAPGTRTLSLLMFDFTLSGQMESAAVVGVMIALICVAMTAAAFAIGRRFGIRE
ncbi:MAG: ABC transporter permease [Burkholderiales bacterium]